jgi:16S rRNA (guanine(966)-N(2))-methyltransferase RsmD
MIRITGGEFRGRRLVIPEGIRPTTDMTRKAVFDLLGPDRLADAIRVADVAAGSGAYGLEAISRGAGEAVLVDSSLAAVRTIQANAEGLGVADRCRVQHSAVSSFARRAAAEGARFSVIFHDPPYADDSSDDLRGLLPLLLPGGILVHERGDDRDPLPGGPTFADRRRYGAAWVLLYPRLD